jgi:hypothetical protein
MPRFPPASLSAHAARRLSERFQIAESDLLHLLNSGFGKRLGVSKESHLVHRLLWSIEDEAPLVAIQDICNGTVLTVLTIDMYRRNYDDRLTDERLRSVINQLIPAGLLPPTRWLTGSSPPTVFVIGWISDDDAWPSSPVNLGRWKQANELDALHLLRDDPAFWTWIAERMQGRGLPLARLRSVTFRLETSEDGISVRPPASWLGSPEISQGAEDESCRN